MSVQDLTSVGNFLVGDTEGQSDWLQAIHSSASPYGDFVCLGLGQRLVLLSAKYQGGNKVFVPVFQQELSVLSEGEQLTSLLTLPVVTAGGRGTATSLWNCTVAGFTSGQLRVYSEAGKLLVQKAFHPSPLKRVTLQSMPEGKHFTNVLHSQSVLELVLVHPELVVTVSGSDLYRSLTDNLSELALATAQGLMFHQLSALPGVKLLVPDQEVSDCGSLVVQQTSYNQYTWLTMQGGLVDDRYKPVHTTPSFLTCGQGPFLQYHDRNPGNLTSPVALAHNVVSSVKSGFFRVATGAIGGLWGGRQEEAEPAVRPDPEVNLNICHSLKDENRVGLELVLSPNRLYSVVRDDRNRVMVVDNMAGVVVQAWRGYHRCQVAWSVTSPPTRDSEESERQVAVLLLLYLPRRGLIEVWSPEQKSKVTEFHVSKHGLLLRSSFACLDDGIPRKRESTSLFAAFLQPDGKVHHFYVPFHCLTTSNTAERDFQIQASLQELLLEQEALNLDQVVDLLLDLRNPQLRSHVLSDMLVGTPDSPCLQTDLVSDLLSGLQIKLQQLGTDNVSIENKLFRSKVLKLSLVCQLHQALAAHQPDLIDSPGSSLEENLSQELVTDLEEVETILTVCPALREAEKPTWPTLSLIDCLSCFETEGDLGTWSDTKSVRLRLRKNIPPLVQMSLYSAVSSLCSSSSPSALDQFQGAGLQAEDFLQLALVTSLHQESLLFSLRGVRNLFQMLHFLLNLGANVDDRHRASCQDLVRRVLRKQKLGPAVFLLGSIWKCVLVAQVSHTLGIYAEEWARKLNQVQSFLHIQNMFWQLLGEGDQSSSHTLASVFESGNGRLSEIISRWLVKLGTTPRSLTRDLDSLETEEEGDRPARVLVEVCSKSFPQSTTPTILVMHLAWDHLQAWTRERDKTLLVEQVVRGCWDVPCPRLRSKFLALVWRTFFHKMLRDTARLTETMARSLTNRSQQSQELLLISGDSVPAWLGHLASLLDCQLQTLGLLTGGEEEEVVQLSYDCLDTEVGQGGLLDHVLSCSVPDLDHVSLEHQLATVLELSWTLKVDLQPMKIFNTAETSQLLNTGPGLMAGLFTDHNVTVNKARTSWVKVVVEAAVGHIHRLVPGEGQQYDTSTFSRLSDKLLQLGRVWFMSDLVRLTQVEALFRAGFDDLATELRPGVTDQEVLSDRLLEVGLLRLAKQVYGEEVGGGQTSAGRMAALPVSLVSQLAERRDSAAGVAEAGLVDTVALLAWVAAHCTEQDRHGLATQSLAAAQVLQVRHNRGGNK